MESWATVLRYRHTMGIKKLFSDQDGTRLVFIDDHNQGYVYTPVSSLLILGSHLNL